jgi:hypothetical protein
MLRGGHINSIFVEFPGLLYSHLKGLASAWRATGKLILVFSSPPTVRSDVSRIYLRIAQRIGTKRYV